MTDGEPRSEDEREYEDPVTDDQETPEERQETVGDAPEEAGQPSSGGDPSAAPETAREIDEDDSPGAAPDAGEEEEEEPPRSSEGSLIPQPGLQKPAESDQPRTFASHPAPPARVAHDPDGRPLLVFVNEVAGGRKLLANVQAIAGSASYVAVAAPQNQPTVGTLIDTDEIRDAARSRVDVTMAVLAEFGFDTVGDVMDPDPLLAMDDAVRAHEAGTMLLSCLGSTRVGLMRKDMVEWARDRFEPDTEVIHIPVRIQDDSVRWDVTHTLVVATQTVNTPDLVNRLKDRASDSPHRYTFICPSSDLVPREKICSDLAATMAELYRMDVDATGQPSSPDPFKAVENAITNYRIDEVLISTFAGEQSRWLEEDLVGRVREITEKPVEHIEAGRPAEKVAAAVAAESTQGAESAGVS